MTLNIIQKHMDKPSLCVLQSNLTMEFIKNNSDKEWRWATISSHKNITMDIIENNPDMEWYPLYVKNNPNVDIMFYIRKFKQFRWEVLFDSQKMSMQVFKWFLEKYKNDELGWDMAWNNKRIWKTVSKHPNITPYDIEENLDEPWNWDEISRNPNLTKEFISIIEKINWSHLSTNKFDYK